MKYQAVLFDLDGTLLPMDQEKFVKTYFGLLVQKVAPLGYDPKQLVNSIWKGTYAMIQNDGSCINYDRFWEVFESIYGKEKLKDKVIFDSFYEKEFQQAQTACGFNALSKQVVEKCKGVGKLVLATNPIFPAVATHSRIRWAGLDPQDFAFITTYENSTFCKPNPQYYQELMDKLDLDPKQCLMIGNDVQEDMVSMELGMDTYLVTDCLINSQNKDLSGYRQGTMEDLLEFVAS